MAIALVLDGDAAFGVGEVDRARKRPSTETTCWIAGSGRSKLRRSRRVSVSFGDSRPGAREAAHRGCDRIRGTAPIASTV
ncbi:hypothetical protein CTI14_48390, partial [Methylobacterium radiotolerans]